MLHKPWLNLFGFFEERKAKKIIKEQDRLNALPNPPCGKKGQHYYWTDMNWPCPICTRMEEDAKKARKEEEDRRLLAKAIAEEIAKINKTP